ncbi:MAG: 4Fe-4S dicluster domain-containing protein, partial [Desulfatiglandales bacterium]
MPYLQIDQSCTGCLACVINCPALAIRFEDRGDRRRLFHSISRCVRCGNCW